MKIKSQLNSFGSSHINLEEELAMKNKKQGWVLGGVLEKIGTKLGAKVLMEPTWGIVGQITFKNGRRSYLRYNTMNLNPMGSSEISRDKDYSNFFMKKMGYPIVPGSKTFFEAKWARAVGAPSRDIDGAYKYARKLGFPVIVKPNSGSQGSGVALVHNRREFYVAMRSIFRKDTVAIVQRPVHGRDYRIVVLDKKVISAYERVPLSIVGDGRSTVRQLLKLKQKEFVASGRDTKLNLKDQRIAGKLLHQGFTFRSVLKMGEKIFLLDNANLSTGGDSVDVTNKIHPAFRRLAVKLTRDMDLRLCGVDLMVEGDIQNKPKVFWVLEINSAPGLDHYSRSGKAQAKIVEQLYLEVLRSLEKKK